MMVAFAMAAWSDWAGERGVAHPSRPSLAHPSRPSLKRNTVRKVIQYRYGSPREETREVRG